MQLHAHLARNVSLSVVDEHVERALETREPEAVVDELGPLGLNAALVACQVALDGEVLKFFVRVDQRDAGRSFVNLTALDAHKAILNDVDSTHALRARELVEHHDGLKRGDLFAVDSRGHTLGERNRDFARLAWRGRILCVRVDVFDGRVPRVLEESGLDGATPHVLVY